MIRVLALMAALMALVLFGTDNVNADDRHQGVIVVDGTQCYEVTPAGEFKPWGEPLAAGTRVSIFTVHHMWSEEWTMIGIGVFSEEGSDQSCLVSNGSVVAVEPTSEATIPPTGTPTIEPTTELTVVPTVDPTMEPTTEPTAEPTVAPIVEPAPTESVIVEESEPAYIPESTVSAADEVQQAAGSTIEPEQTMEEQEAASPPPPSPEATSTAVSASSNAYGVTALPSTGTGSDEPFDWTILLKVGAFAGAIPLSFCLLVAVLGVCSGYRHYKEGGVDTSISRAWKKVLG